MALSRSSTFTLSPVLHCVVNPKRLPGGGFKKKKSAFANKIAKELDRQTKGQGWGETEVRTLWEASLPCPSPLGLPLGPLQKHVSYARSDSATGQLPGAPGDPRARGFLSSPTQPLFQTLPPVPTSFLPTSGETVRVTCSKTQALVPACPLAD